MLNAAHQGYSYQDILGAYFIAQEIANGKRTSKFHFDYKKTPHSIPDKFDDIVIYQENRTHYIQVKYSNTQNLHVLTKQDFSSSSSNDLALFDLFETWKALHKKDSEWRVCLAWEKPSSNDPLLDVIKELPDNKSTFSGTTCYQFNCDKLWSKTEGVLHSWRALKTWSQSNNRKEFKKFLDCLIIEVNLPKSSLLENFEQGLEKKLAHMIEKIGIGVYPNDNLSIRQVAESLSTLVNRKRALNEASPTICNNIAKEIGITQDYGGIEQKFRVDENMLVATPNRVQQVVSAIKQHGAVILTAEPGAGKSWLIENIENHFQNTTQIIKHYCYVALEDPLAIKRISINVMYGSLITQVLQSNNELGQHMTKRYASNLEQLNILLSKIEQKTTLIVDGIDHIWRVYQKNRGGLTEDETKIIEALGKLDLSNPNISVLVISQPIEQLETLTNFYHCNLAKLPVTFTEELLKKNTIKNSNIDGISLADAIHKKGEGNALYIKYLIDHAINNRVNTSLEWIDSLPTYDYNLTGYYKYLYDQIQGDTRVPYALCGADFSITESELKDITHIGDNVTKQINLLKPILKFYTAVGYSIYHESFKHFVIKTIEKEGGSIKHLIYQPLINWLSTHSFFKSTKAYGHLLKLYFEIDDFEKIGQSISIDFIENSLYHAQPFHSISQNYHLQKASLQHLDSFNAMIIIAEQSKMIYELDNSIGDDVLISYLQATKVIHREDIMYRLLWDGENLLINRDSALRFLVNQAYQGEETIHWSILSDLSKIPYEILGYEAIRLIDKKEYEDFDNMFEKVHSNPEYKKALKIILNEIEWHDIYLGNTWSEKTTLYQKYISTISPSVSTLDEAIKNVIENERFEHDDNWEEMIRNIIHLSKKAKKDEIENVIKTLSSYNWFRNWLIFLIKITELSQRKYTDKEVIESFSFLARDIEPFTGTPRACDLYKQLSFINKSFHWGLSLCKKDKKLLTKCCELLENVTKTTTSLQGDYSGPLIDEEFLKIISYYISGEYVVKKYEEYYKPLGSRMYYSYVAKLAFEYAYILGKNGKTIEAKEKYLEGVQALTAYGYRKDITLSEVLNCSVPYQQTYNSLDVKWFFDLYQMSMTVVTHTDGRSTSQYPIEWFKEFIQVFPNEALKFLASETIEYSEGSWHQEEEFSHLLEKCSKLFTPTQWFLLARSLPLLSSNTILDYGLKNINQIDDALQGSYNQWIKSIPNISHAENKSQYSKEVTVKFQKTFDVTIDAEIEENRTDKYLYKKEKSPFVPFPTSSVEEVLSFLKTNELKEGHLGSIKQFIEKISDWEVKKEILHNIALNFRYDTIEKWTDNLFQTHSDEYLYFNICLFVFVSDGWLRGLHYTHYLKRSYNINPEKTISILKEILGKSFLRGNYASLISCNLIKALSELNFKKSVVQELLQTTFQIIQRRLPHPPDSDINQTLYQGIDGFSRNEMVVVLLISRLKTLTSEKTQGIIWSLTYLALSDPQSLFKPYIWSFKNSKYLLPIHRALLLQILIEYVDQKEISTDLIGVLLNIYPTGFFLEDQYIRSLVDYNLELKEDSANYILHTAHKYDDGFFQYMHCKYRAIAMHLGTLTGTYKAYATKRDEISKKHNKYYDRSDEVLTPIVSNANAVYEIVNSQYYASLKELTYYYGPSYTSNLRFFLKEIILQVGSKSPRPLSLPIPTNFPQFKVKDISHPIKNEGWVILASYESELYGQKLRGKKKINSASVLTFGEKPVSQKDLYAQYLFKTDTYFNDLISDTPIDKPICTLHIRDNLEYSNIVYVSPFIIRELDLTVDSFFHNGFQARNNNGETIIKMISWKEDYYGQISDCTEVPRLEGVSVLIRKDYYNQLIGLYQEKGWYVFYQK